MMQRRPAEAAADAPLELAGARTVTPALLLHSSRMEQTPVVILIVLVILGTSYAVTRLVLRAEHPRTPTTTHPQQVCADPSGAQTDAGSQHGPAWGAVDDLQVTRPGPTPLREPAANRKFA